MRHEGYVQSGDLKLYNKVNFRADYLQYEGKKIELIVRKAKSKRSIEQNAYYWGPVLKPICEHTGYDKDVLHELMKERFNPKLIIDFDGKERKIAGSTTKFSISGMMRYIEDVMQFGAELGIIFEPIDKWVSENEI